MSTVIAELCVSPVFMDIGFAATFPKLYVLTTNKAIEHSDFDARPTFLLLLCRDFFTPICFRFHIY